MNVSGETPHPMAGASAPTAVAGPDEVALLVRARRQDGAAWEALVYRYQEHAFRLAYLLLGDGAEAEDVAQEAFVRAYLKLGRFDETRPFRPWLLSITANLARNRRRAIGRYWAALRRFVHAEPDAGASQPPLEARAEAEALWQAVRRLRPVAQEVIYLRYFLELSEVETAETVGVPAGTVKSRLHRALRQLQAVIEQDFPALYEAFSEQTDR
jgi:RNA polymerase sigma-70 factor, ECF subfamily